MKGGLPEAVRRRFDPGQRFGLRLTLIALALILVGIPFSLLLFEVLAKGQLTEADQAIAARLHAIIGPHPFWVGVMQVLSFLGKPIWFYLLIGGVCVALWQRHRYRLIAYLIATPMIGGVITGAIKVAVNRPRPNLPDPITSAFGKSFPSGHAFSSLVSYGVLLLTFLPVMPRKARPFAVASTFIFVLAIGFSRLALGVHFLSDVLAGWVLGAAWLAASTAAFEIWRTERGVRKTKPLEEGVEPEAAKDLPGKDMSR